MTVRDFYANIGGDYEGTLANLLSEDRMKKYILKFADANDYTNLLAALDEQRYEDAFRFSHNIKGVCLNLGFSVLAASGSDLCEALRGGVPTDEVPALLDKVTAHYRQLTAELTRFRDEL